MRFLRHTAVQRLFSLGLLLSLGLWLAAPAAGADAGRTLAAQAEWFGAQTSPTVEAAFEQALVSAASQGARTPEAFAAAFAEALADRPDPALAHFLETHPSADALLSVLYGQLLSAFSHHTGLEAVAGSPLASPAGGTAPGLFARLGHAKGSASPGTATLLRSGVAAFVRPVDERSSAQPLGP